MTKTRKERTLDIAISAVLAVMVFIIFLTILTGRGTKIEKITATVTPVATDENASEEEIVEQVSLMPAEEVSKMDLKLEDFIEVTCDTAADLAASKGEEEEETAPEEVYSYVPTDYEVILLAKLINRESCYEPYEGQVAVGATVMNRLKSDVFPGNTIYEVVTTPGQYDNGVPIDNYTYNEENYQAALDAIAGADPTNGAVFYYNPELSGDTWIATHVLSCVIGHHWFYYVYEA